jgi:hypothetical protein
MTAPRAATREKLEKTEALARLGIAKRERLDKADYDVYVSGLEAFSAATVRRACERLQQLPEPEFGPRFPTLAMILGLCRAIADERKARELPAAPQERASPERLAQFLEDVRAEIRQHEMPSVTARRRS